MLAVPGPTCGVAAGMRCLVHSGGLRNEPRIDRKLSATETVETKRFLAPAGVSPSKSVYRTSGQGTSTE